MNTTNSSSACWRSLTAVLCASTILLGSGCFMIAAGAAGAGTVAYIRGELDATVSGDVSAVYAATNASLQQLQFAKINEGKSAVDAEITARTGQDTKIEIKLNRTTDNLTRVRIRIGVFGDESLARLILDKIKTNL